MNTPERDLTLTFVITALNEEANVHTTMSDAQRALADFNIDGELAVINDGSTDRTGDIIADFMRMNGNVKRIDHATPRGVGASFWEGVDAATKNVICWLPGDNENDPWEIIRYFALLQHVDMVIPFVFNKEKRSLFRNGLSYIYRFIINTTFSVNLNYTNGTVLYYRPILMELPYRSASFFFQTDILIRLIKKGYLFAEIPYRLGVRPGGVSKAVTFPSFLHVVKGYLRLVKDHYTNPPNKSYIDSTVSARRRGEDNQGYLNR